MAEDGEENIFDDRNYHRNDEASEDDAIVNEEQSDHDDDVEGEDLDENLDE